MELSFAFKKLLLTLLLQTLTLASRIWNLPLKSGECKAFIGDLDLLSL
jgi:hypothetical protein